MRKIKVESDEPKRELFHMRTDQKPLIKKKAKEMPAILRDVPPGFNWGWYSREDPRMHLQTVDAEHQGDHKVWLEARGRRVFEPAMKIPSRVLKEIRAA